MRGTDHGYKLCYYDEYGAEDSAGKYFPKFACNAT
jgi:hypothetical protein